MTGEKEIEDRFVAWNQALQTGNPDKVTALYAKDAVLLPTVSARVRHNHDEIRDYFVHFLAKKPVGRIDEQNIRVFGDIAVNSGLYTFTLSENGKETDVAARFSFVYRRDGDRWQIIEHHSSILPEG
ncbi:MAG: SgcJ/EcaC family oxidoreductase [Desulfobacterales bacterium]|nr:SgcJ/EcaC family oxidoreductase [Desulfobacterales bacterium]MCF8078705.1 SgcJ/EcaC family oxidoreductase [Desulfobacterales bacterium]